MFFKSNNSTFLKRNVFPAQAGTQRLLLSILVTLDPRLRGDDKSKN